MNLKSKEILSDIISALFILLFVYAAMSKMVDFQKFRIELGKSPILNSYAEYISYIIPAIELIISVLLAYKKFQFNALYFAFTLMAIFSAYIIAILKYSSYIPCSCGGILQNMTWKQHLIFNIAFLGFGAIAILLYPKTDKDLIRDKKGNLHP